MYNVPIYFSFSMLRRNRIIYLALVILLVLNLIFYWIFTKEQLETQIPDSSDLHFTVIIPFFESFDHDLHRTIKSIVSIYPSVKILVLSKKVPYPYPKLNYDNVKFVYSQSNPAIPRSHSDPLSYVETDYILVLPDGVRLRKNSVEDLFQLLLPSKSNIIVVPIDRSRCLSVGFDIKRWSLTYTSQYEIKKCNFIDGSVLLFNKYILGNFSETFSLPYYESFFIQAHLNNLKTKVVTDSENFNRGKYLYTNRHLKWKHETNVDKQQRALYERFGIKRLLTSNGIEKWYGCTKYTPRCFPSVIDTPSFLIEGRWTPPCCLNGLRKTAQHVFSTLENQGLVYWLEGGSLLGAARHNDIIPWDYDVDIGIHMKDISNISFLKNVWNDNKKHEDNEGFVWERATEGSFIRVQYSKINHLHVDIFPFYEKKGVMTKDTWFKSHRQDMEFPARYLKPLEHLDFVGVKAMVPNHYRDFLEMKFGQGVIENPQYPFPEKLQGVKFQN